MCPEINDIRNIFQIERYSNLLLFYSDVEKQINTCMIGNNTFFLP